MTFDPNDFQDQAAIAAMLQRQKLINAQNQQQSIPENRQCPWCGGGLPGQYSKCQHCASEVSWVDGFPCKPQEVEYRRKLSNQKWEREERRLAKEKKLKDEIAARVVNCKKCGCRVPQLNLKSTIDTCDTCHKRTRRSEIVSLFVIIAVLALIVTLYNLFFI
jgi:primosomal protein N''